MPNSGLDINRFVLLRSRDILSRNVNKTKLTAYRMRERSKGVLMLRQAQHERVKGAFMLSTGSARTVERRVHAFDRLSTNG
jgi:hypothetical protein